VDAGFLQLVRYGILPADDPLVVESLKVVDATLKTETPAGPCWRRYNHDGYGQRGDGSPYIGWGTGRSWPLLTGERAHYELAAGRAPPIPTLGFRAGQPTGVRNTGPAGVFDRWMCRICRVKSMSRQCSALISHARSPQQKASVDAAYAADCEP
jgi:GH15 family glucan-1,4-alpha-glucosidase